MSIAALTGFCLRTPEIDQASHAKAQTETALVISIPPRAGVLIHAASEFCTEAVVLARRAVERFEIRAHELPADLHSLPGRFTAFWASIPSLPGTRLGLTPVILGFVTLLLLIQGGVGTRR